MSEVVERAARQLRDAAESSTPGPPVRDVLGTSADIDLAYAVQQVNTDVAVAAGRRVSGRKIGLTAEVVQQMFDVHQPDFGTLFADMCLADGTEIDADRLLQPRVEGEVALVLATDLDRGRHHVIDVIDATAYALPAIEVVDSRIAGWDVTIVDTVADNAGSGLYVVGTTPVPLSAVDLPRLPMSLSVDGVERSTGVGAACLGNPLNAAVWLADEMCARGTPLRAGECVMTGALGPMVELTPGARVEADFGPLGTVSTRWRAPEA